MYGKRSVGGLTSEVTFLSPRETRRGCREEQGEWEMEDLRDSVIVAHPGTQHSQYLAVGLQKAGLLRLYYTRVFWDPHRWPFNVLRLLGVGRSPRLRSVARRRHPELDPRLARSCFFI